MSKDDIFNIAVIGLGYVGLPLARLFLDSGHTVYGIDVNRHRVQKLLKRDGYLVDVSSQDLEDAFATTRFHVGSAYSVIEKADVVIICVPTPLDGQANPDLKYVQQAVTSMLPFLKRGQLIVLESTTYPGTTEEELVPMIESNGLNVGIDIALAYSPERIDPGQQRLALRHIPKVVSGVTPQCTEYIKRVYRTAFNQVVVVSSPKAAEMMKLVENSQRFVNISFMNELAILCDELGIDLWEVISAAQTKPYGFTPYYPGPGIGGHCIPVDPLYLSWKAKRHRLGLKMIDDAYKINEQMPSFVASKVAKHVSRIKPLSKSRILTVGVTYKKDVNDMRESTAPKIMEKLMNLGAELNFYDPYIGEIKVGDVCLRRIPLTPQHITQHDCTLILTDHSLIRYELIVRHAPLVIDTRNATGQLTLRDHVILL